MLCLCVCVAVRGVVVFPSFAERKKSRKAREPRGHTNNTEREQRNAHTNIPGGRGRDVFLCVSCVVFRSAESRLSPPSQRHSRHTARYIHTYSQSHVSPPTSVWQHPAQHATRLIIASTALLIGAGRVASNSAHCLGSHTASVHPMSPHCNADPSRRRCGSRGRAPFLAIRAWLLPPFGSFV